MHLVKILYLLTPRQINFDMQGFAQISIYNQQIIFETTQHLALDNNCMLEHHFLYLSKLAALLQHQLYF